MTVKVITGYYRYTDVWFEWHKALPNPEDGNPLKALISHDALTHPDNPLRKPGQDGIELYTGTMAETGETRLLFSSAQVDYIRYWLHAMQLTKEIIPLPWSECLLTTAEMSIVSPRIFKDGPSLRKAVKDIEKNNKRLKGINTTLRARRDTFERVRTIWAEKVGTWCAVDFESWDRDHTVLTEFGWSLATWENGKRVTDKGHLIVTENRDYHNTYVPQWTDNYDFGQSQDLDKSAFAKKIRDILASTAKSGPLFLVFHDCGQDIKYLESKDISAPIGGLTYDLPNTAPKEGIFVVDTSDMFAALEGESAKNKRGLSTACHLLQIRTSHLHNAGNDAHYTLMALESMASGDPLDTQREARWPSKPDAPRGVKVQFAPWEEESDFDDMEGIMPPLSDKYKTAGSSKDTTVTSE